MNKIDPIITKSFDGQNITNLNLNMSSSEVVGAQLLVAYRLGLLLKQNAGIEITDDIADKVIKATLYKWAEITKLISKDAPQNAAEDFFKNFIPKSDRSSHPQTDATA